MIAREKDFFIQKIEDYKTQAKFAPLCIGFYRMSGTIGKRRAKRAIHLLNQSTEEGTNFIIYILSTLSASTLHSYLLNNDRGKSVIQHVKEQKLEKNLIFVVCFYEWEHIIKMTRTMKAKCQKDIILMECK